MSRRAAFTEAAIRRAIRAAKAEGAESVRIIHPNGEQLEIPVNDTTRDVSPHSTNGRNAKRREIVL